MEEFEKDTRDTEHSERESQSADDSVRKREFTERGMQYEAEKICELYTVLQKLSEKVIGLIESQSSNELIKAKNLSF